MIFWGLIHAIQHVCPWIFDKPVKEEVETKMNSGMTGSGMEDIRSDVNEEEWFPEGKNGVDSKKVTSTLT